MSSGGPDFGSGGYYGAGGPNSGPGPGPGGYGQGPGGFGPFGGFGGFGPRGPYGAWPGCGCSTLLIILAGLFLVCAGGLRILDPG